MTTKTMTRSNAKDQRNIKTLTAKLASLREQHGRVTANRASWPDPHGDFSISYYDNLLARLAAEIVELQNALGWNRTCQRCGQAGNVEHDNGVDICNPCTDAVQSGYSSSHYDPNERAEMRAEESADDAVLEAAYSAGTFAERKAAAAELVRRAYVRETGREPRKSANEIRKELAAAKRSDALLLLAEQVHAHAYKNYESDGWDIVVDVLSTNQLVDLIDGARTRLGAIRKIGKFVKRMRAAELSVLKGEV